MAEKSSKIVQLPTPSIFFIFNVLAWTDILASKIRHRFCRQSFFPIARLLPFSYHQLSVCTSVDGFATKLSLRRTKKTGTKAIRKGMSGILAGSNKRYQMNPKKVIKIYPKKIIKNIMIKGNIFGRIRKMDERIIKTTAKSRKMKNPLTS